MSFVVVVDPVDLGRFWLFW